MPLKPLARAAAIKSSGLETPSPEKNRPSRTIYLCNCFNSGSNQLFHKNTCFGVAFLVNTIELVVVQAAIVSGFVQQFRVCPDLLNPAGIHHDNLIGGQNSGEPMCDGDYRPASRQFCEGPLNLLFRFGIER